MTLIFNHKIVHRLMCCFEISSANNLGRASYKSDLLFIVVNEDVVTLKEFLYCPA